jgi:SAM-dependent methyltransferase
MTTAAPQKKLAIEQHSAQATEFADRYEQLKVDAYRSCFTYSRHRLDQWLEQLLPVPTGQLLLDVGCGTGNHLARLRAKGFEAAGVDGSPEMLAEARRLNPGADLRPGDVEALPFADAAFELVVCIEVLRYLRDPYACVREIARVLRPGGQALVTAAPLLSWNGYWLVNRIAHRLPVGNLVRLKQFFATTASLHRLFRRAGFGSIAIHGVYCGPLNWVERLVPALLPRFLRAWEPLDRVAADHILLREFSNMFLVQAVKEA